MANEITIGTEFRALRISKSGKESYRSALGVITSGNKAEKIRLANTVIEGLWSNATYRPIVGELQRVFANLFKLNKSFGTSFAAVCGLVAASPSKVGMLAFFEAVIKADAESPLKGEKAIYCAAMVRIVALEREIAAELAREQAHAKWLDEMRAQDPDFDEEEYCAARALEQAA
jgi:hypothetical protein